MSDILVKISEAVQHVSRLTKSGASLHDALVKVALDRDLTAEQVKRMVETVNVANTLGHFKAGQKRAEFPVSDSREILSEAFNTKKASADPAFPTPDEYLVDDRDHFTTFDDRLMQKRAQLAIENTPPPARYLQNPNEIVLQVQREIGRMEKEASVANEAAEGMRHKVYTAVQHLAESFQMYRAPSLLLFQKEAAAIYGETGQSYFPVLQKLVHPKFQGTGLEKVASAVDTGTRSHQIFQHLCAVEQEFARQSQIALEKQAEAEHWKGELRSVFTKAAERGTDTDPSPGSKALPAPSPSPPGGPAPFRKPPRAASPPVTGGAPVGGDRAGGGGGRSTKVIKGVESGLGGGIGAVGAAFGAAPAAFAAMNAGLLANLEPLLGDPAPYGYYEQLGDTLRMQDSIQQVMMNDPVMKHRDPREMLPILQTVIRAAPNLAMHPPVLAAILREATSGQYASMDPMTLTQLAQAQQALFKNQLLRQQQLSDSEIRTSL